MKEDILEQMVDDWLLNQDATFTKHNVKYKPSRDDIHFKPKSDAVHSDIDILSVNLNANDEFRVRAISCKSYQAGFNLEHWHSLLTIDDLNGKNKMVSGREAWKHHRELCMPKWGKALARKVYSETKSTDFIWTLVVTKLVGNNIEFWKEKFENEVKFIENLKFDKTSKVRLEVKTVRDLIEDYFDKDFSDSDKNNHTLEANQFGRLLQVLKAANIDLKKI